MFSGYTLLKTARILENLLLFVDILYEHRIPG